MLRRGLAVEFLVIFAGVTLGLLADDWRQNRLEALEAERALFFLREDLLRDSAELAAARGVLQRQSAATAWVQRNWDKPAVDADSAGHAFRAYLFLPSFAFPRSAFESLLATNRLSLVRPDSLRAAVVQYYDRQAWIERGYPGLVTAKEETVDAWSPYFLRPPSRDPTSAWPMAPGPGRLTARWSTIREDNTAYNQISYAGAYAAVTLSSVGEQLERNGALLALLRTVQH